MTVTLTNKPQAATATKNSCLVIRPRYADESQKTFMVLGVERGGTSMVAGVIRSLGINMGKRVGLNHEDPLFLTEQLDQLKNRIAQRNNECDVWGFKVPKASLMLPFYDENLRNPYYIVVYRNIGAVVDSWKQRTAANYLDAVDHVLDYYLRIQKGVRTSSRPVLFVNYERAISDQERTVRELADFIGADKSEDNIRRGVAMITGDGQGYVNLPEHFFRVTPTPSALEQPRIDCDDNAAEITGEDDWIEFNFQKTKLVFTPREGEFFPKNFWIALDLETTPDVDLATGPLRVYFDFIGEMFPAHCARPILARGSNTLLVETNGNVRAVGFGAFTNGQRYKLTSRFFIAD